MSCFEFHVSLFEFYQVLIEKAQKLFSFFNVQCIFERIS